jgi:cbb3-type cytochrome oxidase subunit 3
MLLLAQATQPATGLIDFIAPLIPWVIIFLCVWIFVFRVQRRQSRMVAERTVAERLHHAAVEAKLDRLIELAERRNNAE